jgi:hypothetical protein
MTGDNKTVLFSSGDASVISISAPGYVSSCFDWLERSVGETKRPRWSTWRGKVSRNGDRSTFADLFSSNGEQTVLLRTRSVKHFLPGSSNESKRGIHGFRI